LTVHYHSMRDGQEDQVVKLIQTLIEEYGADFESVLTADTLRASRGFLNVEVAEKDGVIIGLCTWVMTFSTWRGMKGIYLNDHFVLAKHKNSEVAYNLMWHAARNGASQGARFIRTEVDISEEAIDTIYEEVGFYNQVRHSLRFMEPREFDKLVAAPQRGIKAA
jgi:hypothetical protein